MNKYEFKIKYKIGDVSKFIKEEIKKYKSISFDIIDLKDYSKFLKLAEFVTLVNFEISLRKTELKKYHKEYKNSILLSSISVNKIYSNGKIKKLEKKINEYENFIKAYTYINEFIKNILSSIKINLDI